VGETISQTITIVPGEGKVFKIIKINTQKGTDFKQTKEIEVEGRPAYELTVENIKKTEGRYF